MKEPAGAGVIGAATSRGRRRVNQDAVLAVTLSNGSELIAVADGMGGHSAGEVASRTALDVLHASLEGGADLVTAVTDANAAVFAAAAAVPEQGGMGTTLAAVLRRGMQYTVASVGDSRAYRVDFNGIRQITTDHSFIAEAVRSGELTAEEAGNSPWRNAVTRAIGTDREVDVDCYGPFAASDPHVVVLCTDGLYRSVDLAEMARIIRSADPTAAARRLALAAYEAGSDDNITVAIVSYGMLATGESSDAEAAYTVALQDATRESAPARPDDDPAFRRHARGRRLTPAHRWARFEVGAILFGLLAIMLYVLILAKSF